MQSQAVRGVGNEAARTFSDPSRSGPGSTRGNSLHTPHLGLLTAATATRGNPDDAPGRGTTLARFAVAPEGNMGLVPAASRTGVSVVRQSRNGQPLQGLDLDLISAVGSTLDVRSAGPTT